MQTRSHKHRLTDLGYDNLREVVILSFKDFLEYFIINFNQNAFSRYLMDETDGIWVLLSGKECR